MDGIICPAVRPVSITRPQSVNYHHEILKNSNNMKQLKLLENRALSSRRYQDAITFRNQLLKEQSFMEQNRLQIAKANRVSVGGGALLAGGVGLSSLVVGTLVGAKLAIEASKHQDNNSTVAASSNSTETATKKQ